MSPQHDPGALEQTITYWEAIADDALSVMADGDSPSQAVAIPARRKPIETAAIMVLAFLENQTELLCRQVSGAVPSFDQAKCWAVFECAKLWDELGRNPASLLSAQSTLRIANVELARVRREAATLTLVSMANGGDNDRKEAKADEGEKVPPIICYQAELAPFVKCSKNTSGLAEKLEAKGILRKFVKPEKHKGLFLFWFNDAEQHETIRLAISRNAAPATSKPSQS